MDVIEDSGVILPPASINAEHIASNILYFESKRAHALYFNVVRIADVPKVPLWEKYTLSVDEAALYFGIGQNRLRSIVASNPSADYIVTVGAKTLIKRKVFERYIDEATAI